MSALDWLGRLIRPRQGGPAIPGAPAPGAAPIGPPPHVASVVQPPRVPVAAVGDAPRPVPPVVVPLRPPAPTTVPGLPMPGELVALGRLTERDRRGVLRDRVVDPVLAWLALLSAERIRPTPEARVMLLTIAGQEGDAQYRVQHGNGPARGLWQFERGGGVAGVLTHAASRDLAARICAARGLTATPAAVHPELARDDALAGAFARLLLWTDPRPLPTAEEEGWRCYLRNWRPGAYERGSDEARARLRAKWATNWRLAVAAVTGG